MFYEFKSWYELLKFIKIMVGGFSIFNYYILYAPNAIVIPSSKKP